MAAETAIVPTTAAEIIPRIVSITMTMNIKRVGEGGKRRKMGGRGEEAGGKRGGGMIAGTGIGSGGGTGIDTVVVTWKTQGRART